MQPEPTPAKAGAPRSEHDAEFLERFEARMRLPIVLSALLPLIIIPEPGKPVSIAVGIATWLVFLIDFVVQARHTDRYVRTGLGRFDLAIVLVTAPWYLFPAVSGGEFVMLLRVARLGRVFLASPRARQLFNRLGKVAIVASLIVLVASLVAYGAEHAKNTEFATIGDALWWGVVTLTTVGYGDIVPVTRAGRVAGVVIMFTGIAVLGVLSGTLASFFRLGSSATGDGDPDDPAQPEDATATGDPSGHSAPIVAPGVPTSAIEEALTRLAAQISGLRAELHSLSERVGVDASGGADRTDPDNH